MCFRVVFRSFDLKSRFRGYQLERFRNYNSIIYYHYYLRERKKFYLQICFGQWTIISVVSHLQAVGCQDRYGQFIFAVPVPDLHLNTTDDVSLSNWIFGDGLSHARSLKNRTILKHKNVINTILRIVCTIIIKVWFDYVHWNKMAMVVMYIYINNNIKVAVWLKRKLRKTII